MNQQVQALFDARDSANRDDAFQAFDRLMAAAKNPVDWAYEVWDRTVEDLGQKNGQKRAFAAQLLAHLAISDPEERMLAVFPALAAVMRDDKTVTARHALQSIWRVGLAGPKQKRLVVEALARRFEESAAEKNGSLWKTDAITSLGHLARAADDSSIAELAARLIESEIDEKARKKQRAAWKKAAGRAI